MDSQLTRTPPSSPMTYIYKIFVTILLKLFCHEISNEINILLLILCCLSDTLAMKAFGPAHIKILQ